MKLPKTGEIALIDMDGSIANYDAAIRSGLQKLASPDEPEIPEDIRELPLPKGRGFLSQI